LKTQQVSSLETVLEWICVIQQIPAPTFSEKQRAVFMQSEFSRLGMHDVHFDSAGNVLARWPGGSAPPLVVSAHLDTVHCDLKEIPLERTDQRLTGPAVADNSTGLAGLLFLARHLCEVKPSYPGDIWLAANVCEEGLGNLAGMQAVVDTFGAEPRAYVILEGLGLGQICHRGLGVNRLKVTVETSGGHSWVDYGKPSAIHILADIISQLTHLSLPRKPRASLNVGIIQGGTTVNTIAPSAYLLLDLRAEDHNTLLRITDKARSIVHSYARNGVTVALEQIGSRPAGEIPPDHPLVQLAMQVLHSLNLSSSLEIGSTDANIPLNCGYPAVCIGLTRGNHPHTQREYIEIAPLQTGLAQILALADQVWQIEK